MTCLKCEEKIYCSKFCKKHFVNYFKRKFKKHLSKYELLEKGEALNVKGENKEVVKHLLNDLGRKVSVKLSEEGRVVESYTLTTKSVKLLTQFMKKEGFEAQEVSFMECFTNKEVQKFAKLKNLRIEDPILNCLEQEVKQLMDELMERRPNIYYCTYNMMNSFLESVKKVK